MSVALTFLVILRIAAFASAPDSSTSQATTPESDQTFNIKQTVYPLPMHRIAFPHTTWIGKAVFSKDGQSLYVHVPNNSINLWEVGVYYWPEALGGLLAIAVLICIIALRRINQTPRIRGAPHCRKCNYCLIDHPRDHCPECGCLIKRPIIGGRQWVRMLPWNAALVVVVIIYGGLWAIRAPRTGWASNYFSWWSKPLNQWASSHNIAWLTARSQVLDEIVEYDVVSGTPRRTLAAFPTWLGWKQENIALTPDGMGLVLPTFQGDALTVISTVDGAVLNKMICPEIPTSKSTRWRHISGFSDDGSEIYTTALDEKNKKTKLVGWNWRTGTHKLLLETEAYSHQNARRTALLPRSYLHIPNSDPIKFLEMPNRFEAGSNEVQFWIRDGSNPNRIPVPISTTVWGFQMPIFFPDSSKVWIHQRIGSALRSFDTKTGQSGDRLASPAFRNFRQYYQYDPSSQRLVVGVYFNHMPWQNDANRYGFLVKDVTRDRWIGEYEIPQELIHSEGLIISPGGHYFATEAFKKDTNLNKYVNEILIYDLRSLPKPASLSKRALRSWGITR